MIVGVLTTCHIQYTWDSSICIFLFNRTTLQVFVTYLTRALYVHPLWFCKHQHDNRVRSTQNAFSLPFAAILVNYAPSGEIHNYCTPHIIKENLENFLIHRYKYILLSEVYCIWQAVKTPTVILNNPVCSNASRLRGMISVTYRGTGDFLKHEYSGVDPLSCGICTPATMVTVGCCWSEVHQPAGWTKYDQSTLAEMVTLFVVPSSNLLPLN
jgi:hypothetical protein